MDELKQRLRSLINERIPYGHTAGQFDDVWMQLRHLEALVEDAARIGAELEREACADVVAPARLGSRVSDSRRHMADAIRARGSK